MDSEPIFQLGVMNAWLLCIPFLLPAFFIGVMRKDIAKRMSDMTGYNAAEKFFTITASLAPYPFMISTVWTPFTSFKPLLYGGLLLYGFGILAFYASIYVVILTPPDKPLSSGVYRLSRNPMYVSAALVFLGICMLSANLQLFAYLVGLIVFQHFMILAEERICRQKYGAAYQVYVEKVPRYLMRLSHRPLDRI